MSPREFILGALLALALIASTVSGDSEDSSVVIQPAYKPPVDAGRARVAEKPDMLTRLELDRLDKRTGEGEPGDLFGSKSWYVPPPPPKVDPVTIKPPAPVAPPLPFTYFGRITDSNGDVVVYLHRSGQVYTLKQGEKIEDQYQLESVSETQLGFVYLPLKARQTLNLPRQ